MRVLDRYITREFLKIFIFGIIILLLVSTVVDIFQWTAKIVEHNPPFSVVITYFLARIPQDLVMITPISILLSTLLVFGAFSRHSEIIAMLANGVSIYRIIVPLLVIGLVMSLLMFGLNEFIVPPANRIVEECKRIMRGKPDRRMMAQIQIWFRDAQEKCVYYIEELIPEPYYEIHGLTIFELNEQFLPDKRLDAQRAVYKFPTSQSQKEGKDKWKTRLSNFLPKTFRYLVTSENQEDDHDELGTWTLYQGAERFLKNSGKKTNVTFQERRDYVIPHSFEEFRRETKDPEDMNYWELAEYIEKLTASGYDVSKYVADLQAKLSYPVVSLVMVIIGFPFALKAPRSGAAMGVGLSVFIGITYWVILQLGISLGHAHILPPLLAAWISHIVFVCTGFYLILSTRT
jgi:lipopolysaccharide export system permease protein